MDCPVCFSEFRPRPTTEYYIHTCRNCRSGILIPRPAATDLINLHSNEAYFAHEYFEARRELDEDLRRDFENKIELLVSEKKSLEGKTLLDIGCDTGNFMKYLQDNYGVIATGVDISVHAVEYGKKNGLNILHGQLEDLGLEDESFDFITGYDLIEHVDDPDRFLKESRRILKDNGKLVLETPNYNALVYTIGKVLMLSSLSRSLFRGLLKRLWPDFHVQYFTRESISQLLTRNNFEVSKCFTRELSPSEVVISSQLLHFVVVHVLGRLAVLTGAPSILSVVASKKA